MKKDQVQGERDDKASRHDREKTEAFNESGRVEEAARNAEPKSGSEREELERGGQIGRSRAADEDLLLHDDDEAELDLPR